MSEGMNELQAIPDAVVASAFVKWLASCYRLLDALVMSKVRIRCQLIQPLHVQAVAIDAEFLLGNHHRSQFQIFFDFSERLRNVRHFVRGKGELIRVLSGKLETFLVAKTFGFEAVGCTV